VSPPEPSGNGVATVVERLPLWKKLAFSGLIVTAFFGLAELSLAVLGVRPALVEEDPYVGFSSYLRLFEPASAWMETAPGKRALFNHQSFPKAKTPGAFRIFTLGGSTTYGRPFEDSTSFTGWLREYLQALSPSRSWEVINAGGISYGSYRVANVMQELVDYQPDLFILYTGNNEFLEKRTYPDPIAPPRVLSWARQGLGKTRIWAAAQKVVGTGRQSARRKYEMTGEVEELLDSSAGLDLYYRDEAFARRVLDHYHYNLRRLVRLARASGASVMLVTIPVNEKDFSPFKSQHRTGLSEAERQRHGELLARAAAALEEGEARVARDAAAKAAELDPLFAEGHYLLGRALLSLGEAETAGEAFNRAIAEDVCPLRALPETDRLIRETAREEGATLVDFRSQLKTRMRERSGHENLGSELFMDHVHPTVEVHGLLAKELLVAMSGLGILDQPAEGWERVQERVSREVLARVDAEAEARAYKNLSKVLIWAGKRKEAEKYVRQAAAVLGDDWEVHYNAGVVQLEAGQDEQAIESFQEAIRLNPGAAWAYDRLGAVYAALGDSDRAVQAGRKAVEIDPTMAGAWNNLGTFYSLKGDLTQALEAAEKALALEPDFAQAHNNLGNHLFALGRLDEALKSYDQALAHRPAFAQALANRGLLLGQQGQFQQALESLSAALELDDGLAQGHVGRGKALLGLGDLAGATLAFERAIERDPQDLEAHELLARALVTAGESAKAKQGLLRGIRTHPAPARLHHAHGRILAGEGNHEAAAEAFARAIALDDGLLDARLDLGRLRMVQGRPREAIRTYRDALTGHESSDTLHHTLATALLATDQLEEGRAHLEQAMKLNPANAATARDLAIVCEHQGELERALELYETAVRLDPSLAGAHEGAARLASRQQKR